MPEKLHVIGAGMAGLIAGHFFRAEAPVILEAQPGLPQNHEALLRFRSDAVAKLTGVKMSCAQVRKGIVECSTIHNEPNIRVCNMYSDKVLGEVCDRSIWNLSPESRYMAPPDFLERASNSLRLKYSFAVSDRFELEEFTRLGPVISTIPMPVMMNLIGWKDKPEFKALPIWVIHVDIVKPKTSVYQTLYYPEAHLPQYRASLGSGRLTIECVREPDQVDFIVGNILRDFGIERAETITHPVKLQRLGKIAPIDEDLRREFIYTLTREFGVYSLGRFATWRQILLDDVVQDCSVIAALIGGEARRRRYTHSLTVVKG